MLVQHNGICFGYFMPISHGVIKKAPQPTSKASSSFLQTPLLNLQTAQAPLPPPVPPLFFRKIHPTYWFFMSSPPLPPKKKIWIFQ